jgi:hypothetical protein
MSNTTTRDTHRTQQGTPAMSNTPITAKPSNTPTTAKRDSKAMLEQYLSTRKKVGTGNGRLLFALDATASRRECWNTACRLQAEMFRQAGAGLSVSLAYFKGEDEFRATNWVSSGEALVRPMLKLEVETGFTQIAKVLDYALCTHAEKPIAAVIFVGDACEENIDELSGLASELGTQGLPVFMFLEGKPGKNNKDIEHSFRSIAERSGGDFFWFGIDSPKAVAQFADTLKAVAKLAVGDASAITTIRHMMITHDK